jgi:hypothetical protein
MMNLNNAVLKQVSTHFVGNKHNEQELVLADAPVVLNELLAERLSDYFLGKMASVHERFQFSHSSSLEFNEVYNFMNGCFNEQEKFHVFSAEIAAHLYEQTDHHNIRSGELHVCYFTNCVYEQEVVDAVGLFKTEVKTGYLEVRNEEERSFTIDYRQGIDLSKFDKGCLVFNIRKEEGYEVVILDRHSKGDEARYWREQFLGLKQKSNEFHQTSQVLGMAKEFISSHVTEEFMVPKTDQIEMLNKSVAYFKSHEAFDGNEFANEVFEDEEVARSFQSFNRQYRDENAMEFEDRFEISPEAVKKQAKIFKSVLKLDKNFHIYIHGNRKLIERGVDEATGRKFYKIFYEEEK